MPTIKDANIKKHETFQFLTYTFKNLNIKIKKQNLVESLKELYKLLTNIELGENKKEIKQINNNEVQYVLFYGDFNLRKGFEYIYTSQDSTIETTASYYIFQQTIAENFYIYFNLADKKFPLNPDRDEHQVEEIVVYMAQFYDVSKDYYENLFNQALNFIDEFIKKASI